MGTSISTTDDCEAIGVLLSGIGIPWAGGVACDVAPIQIGVRTALGATEMRVFVLVTRGERSAGRYAAGAACGFD